MLLDRDRPEIITPPEHPPACCNQHTITVPPACRGQDPPETRLPVGGLAAVLHPAHQRRTSQRHHQRHRQQQHRPRLVPPHRPDRDHAVDRLPARHPQPARPGLLPGPAARQRPPRRRRPAPAHPQTTPHQPRRARHRAAITSDSSPRHGNPAGQQTSAIPHPSARTDQPAAGTTRSNPVRGRPSAASQRHRSGTSDPNVNMEPGEV